MRPLHTHFVNLTSIFRRNSGTEKQTSKNKTHKKSEKIAFKFGLLYKHTVTKVTAIETNKGTANGVVRLWERVKAERFAVTMTPLVGAERLARKTERFSERPDKNG